MNKDGFLDINELGDSVAEDYQDKFDDDEELWVKMTSDSWINQEELIGAMEEESGKKDIGDLIRQMNFEDNPNVTLWQFIRAHGTQPRNRLDQIIIKHPLMVEDDGDTNDDTKAGTSPVKTTKLDDDGSEEAGDGKKNPFQGFSTLGEFLEEDSPFDPEVIAKKFEEERAELRKYIEKCGIPRAQVVIDVEKMKREREQKRKRGPPPGMMPPWMKPGPDGKMPLPPWAKPGKDGKVPPMMMPPPPPQPKLYDLDDEIPDFYDNDVIQPKPQMMAPPTKEQQEMMKKQMEQFMKMMSENGGGGMPQFADETPKKAPITPKGQPLAQSRGSTPKHTPGQVNPIRIRGSNGNGRTPPGQTFQDLKKSANFTRKNKNMTKPKPMSKSFVGGGAQRMSSIAGAKGSYTGRGGFSNSRPLNASNSVVTGGNGFQNPFAKNKFGASTGASYSTTKPFGNQKGNTMHASATFSGLSNAGAQGGNFGNKKKTITGSPLRNTQLQISQQRNTNVSPTKSRRVTSPSNNNTATKRQASPFNNNNSTIGLNRSPVTIRGAENNTSRTSTSGVYNSYVGGNNTTNRTASPLNNRTASPLTGRLNTQQSQFRSNNYGTNATNRATSPTIGASNLGNANPRISNSRISNTYGSTRPGINNNFSPSRNRNYAVIGGNLTGGSTSTYNARTNNFTSGANNYSSVQVPNNSTNLANRFMSPSKGQSSFGGANQFRGGGARTSTLAGNYTSPGRTSNNFGASTNRFGGGVGAQQYSPRRTTNASASNWGSSRQNFGATGGVSNMNMRSSVTGNRGFGGTNNYGIGAGNSFGAGRLSQSGTMNNGRMSTSHVF